MQSFRQHLVTEAIDTPYPWKWTNKTPNHKYKAEFTTDHGVTYTVKISIDTWASEPVWEFSFHIRGKENSGMMHDLSGTGKPFQVFATAGEILEAFLKIEKPNGVYFLGARERADLYVRFARSIPRRSKYINANYLVSYQRKGHGSVFVSFVSKKLKDDEREKFVRANLGAKSEMHIYHLNEALDRPLPWHWTNKSQFKWIANFDVTVDSDIIVDFEMFMRHSDTPLWALSFEDTKVGISLSNDRKSLMVFATIRDIMIDFMKKAPSTDIITFSGNPKRSKLYKRFAHTMVARDPYIKNRYNVWYGTDDMDWILVMLFDKKYSDEEARDIFIRYESSIKNLQKVK